MKKIFKAALPVLLSITAAAGLASCSGGSASLLREPTVVSAEENEGSYTEIISSLRSFAANLGGDYFSDEDDNAIISPVSVYMALALASECAGGDTKSEILNVIGTDGETLKSSVPALYSALNKTFKSDGKERGRVMLTNSVWYDSGIKSLKTDCLDELAENYKAYSYQADFSSDNAAANKAVKNFVKEKTNKLIDCDWELSDETLLALINTLYIKDVWNTDGDDLFSYGKADFLNADGKTENTTLYSAYYRSGKAAEAENCSYFYATTTSGFTLTFVKPDDGISVNSVLNAANIEKFLSGEYETVNDEKKEIYKTRCIFPEFELDTNEDISANLKNLGITDLFDKYTCDFSSVTDEDVYCSKVRHAAKLNVDKTGIEGAAVTIVAMDGTSAGPDDEYTTIYDNFILDRSFGLVVSYRNIPLFIGALNSL